jgi:predicted transcriptional regulator
MIKQRITIQNIDKPKNNKLKEDVKWICNSLGLIKGRDVENVSFRVMYELLELFSKENLISTEKISKILKIESYRINHHIRRLMESGIVFREKRKIALRGGSLSAAIEEVRRDSEIMFSRLKEVSKKIDGVFKL